MNDNIKSERNLGCRYGAKPPLDNKGPRRGELGPHFPTVAGEGRRERLPYPPCSLIRGCDSHAVGFYGVVSTLVGAKMVVMRSGRALLRRMLKVNV